MGQRASDALALASLICLSTCPIRSKLQRSTMQVKLRPLPQQVASVLVRRIAAGELPNGLAPSEVQICIEFRVSRAVAREALKILSALDMVDIAQGRRINVRS